MWFCQNGAGEESGMRGGLVGLENWVDGKDGVGTDCWGWGVRNYWEGWGWVWGNGGGCGKADVGIVL